MGVNDVSNDGEGAKGETNERVLSVIDGWWLPEVGDYKQDGNAGVQTDNCF